MAYTFLLSKTPALAYSSDAAALLPCLLSVKYSAALKRAAVLLRVSSHINGLEQMQAFSLVYQADNFSSIFIQPTTVALSPEQCMKIARRKNQLTAATLHLTLFAPCLIQCDASGESLAPKPGHETRFHELRDLACATVANIVFDVSYIHPDHDAAFFRLTTRRQRLAGLPVDEYHVSSYKDWTIFVPSEAVDAPFAKESESEAPPQYTKVPAKRAASLSNPSSPRECKRKLYLTSLEPPPDILPPSPTEKATSTTASPKPQPSSPPPHHLTDVQHLVANAIESLLPEALRKARETDKNTLEEQLPGALQKLSSVVLLVSAIILMGLQILPGMLAHIFSVSPSSPLPPQPKATDKVAADPNADVPALVATCIRNIAEKTLEEMHFDASRDAVLWLDEAADDHKADLNESKDEGITELQIASETSLNAFQDVAAEVVEQMRETLEGHADDVYLEVWDSISDLVAIKESISAKAMRRLLAREGQVFKKEIERRQRLRAAREET